MVPGIGPLGGVGVDAVGALRVQPHRTSRFSRVPCVAALGTRSRAAPPGFFDGFVPWSGHALAGVGVAHNQRPGARTSGGVGWTARCPDLFDKPLVARFDQPPSSTTRPRPASQRWVRGSRRLAAVVGLQASERDENLGHHGRQLIVAATLNAG